MKMAIKAHTAILIAAVVCLVSLSSVSGVPNHEKPKFEVIGTVYCDPCRAKFVTRVAERMPGAKVRLECQNTTDEKVTFTKDGETDANGVYAIEVEGDHGDDEICGVKPVKSAKEDCSEIIQDGWAKEFTRVSLTNKNGMVSKNRNVNPILYLRTKPIAICPEVFKEIHYIPGEELHP